MSFFKVLFTTDNAAFDSEDGPYEIARILHQIADQVEQYCTAPPIKHQSIVDINGNDIGRYVWLEEES